MESNTIPRIDALLPAEIARKAEELGVKKAGMNPVSLLTLAVLAGAFISLGAVFSTTVTAGGADLPYGVARLLAGLTFSLGLILVVVGGAELFTGNNLIIMAWASGKVPMPRLLLHWAIVYLGNFVGATGTAVLVFLAGQYAFGSAVIGAAALATAHNKLALGFGQAIILGILCNGLVCLAVWLSYSGRSTTDKILSVVPPITAFVAAGFEHSIANMYFIPHALLIKANAPDALWTRLGKSSSDYPLLTIDRFLVGNLLPVTIGNIIGGAVLVGAVYWFVYLRSSGT